MPARDGDGRAAGHDARPRQVSAVDGVAQVHRQEWQRTHIAHSREPGLQVLSRIHHPGKGAVEGRVFEVEDIVIPVSSRAQVRVAVDQPRQHHRLREIGHLRARRDQYLRRRAHSGDAVLLDFDHHVLPVAVAGAVEQPARFDVLRGRRLRYRALAAFHLRRLDDRR